MKDRWTARESSDCYITPSPEDVAELDPEGTGVIEMFGVEFLGPRKLVTADEYGTGRTLHALEGNGPVRVCNCEHADHFSLPGKPPVSHSYGDEVAGLGMTAAYVGWVCTECMTLHNYEGYRS